MNRKTFLKILISTVVIIVLAVVAFLIISFWKGGQSERQDTGFSLFPGRSNVSEVTQVSDQGSDQGSETETPVDQPQSVDRLRRLADFPVIALSGYYRTEKIIVERIVDAIIEEGEEPSKVTETEVLDIEQLYSRYIRQEDGSVFTSKIADTLKQEQTTLGSIPYAGDGEIGNDGRSFLYRFFNENSQSIETFLGTVVEKSIPEAVCAVPLPDEVTADSGDVYITLLQEFLNYNLETTLVVDGYLNTSTREALKDFQTKEGLDVTGQANIKTTGQINNLCLSIVEERVASMLPEKITGVFLPKNITATSVSPSTDNMVYFAKQTNETVVVTLNFATQTLEQLFTTPFSEWAPHWTGEESITLYTKPSGLVDGYLYNLSTVEGTLTKLESSVSGLTGTMNGAQEKLFVSEGGSSVSNQIINISDGSKTPVSFKTLPEKCVWSKDSVIIYCAVPDFLGRGLYPDDWYKGKVSFTDSMWSLNTQTGETRQLSDLSREGNEAFDVIEPSLEENELFMFFINKRTGEPWILEL